MSINFKHNHFGLRLAMLASLILASFSYVYLFGNMFNQVPNLKIESNNKLVINSEKLQASKNRQENILIENKSYSGFLEWYSLKNANFEYYLILKNLESEEVRTETEIAVMFDEFKINIPRAGLYSLKVCARFRGYSDCPETNPVRRLIVVPNKLEELVEWQNKANNKANLVFVGDVLFQNRNVLQEYIKNILSLNGEPLLLDSKGNLIQDIVKANSKVADISFGPFAIEPMKSQRAKFNLWYSPALFYNLRPAEVLELVQKNGYWLNSEWDKSDKISYIYLGENDIDYSTFASLVSSVEPAPDFAFGNTILRASPTNYKAGFILAHEFGHSLFGLYDEYGLRTDERVTGYPNCATDLKKASEWWGKLEGEVDPFFTDWLATLKKYGLDKQLAVKAEKIKVGFVYGGCGARYSSDNTIRPTEISLMDDTAGVPVWGSVNRARVEEVLGLLQGN